MISNNLTYQHANEASTLGYTDFVAMGHHICSGPDRQVSKINLINIKSMSLFGMPSFPQYFFAIRICLRLYVTPKQSVHFPSSCKAEHLPFFVHLQVTSEQCINASVCQGGGRQSITPPLAPSAAAAASDSACCIAANVKIKGVTFQLGE